MSDATGIYVNGTWRTPATAESIAVTDASTGETLATVPSATDAEVRAAVDAATGAFAGWAATPVAERASLLAATAAALSARRHEIATMIAREVGMPHRLSNRIQVGLPVATFTDAAARAASLTWSEKIGNSTVRREPIGVVAAITPWNYPLHQAANKLAGALAAGCTVVLKPSEVAPLSAIALFEILDGVGFPAGVVNLVSGPGPTTGEALVRDPRVAMVSFTGSTRAGRRIMELAARDVKRVALELGGKSANVILPSADFERAIPDALFKCFLNSGQTCSALTRLLVPRSQLERVEDLVRQAIPRFAPGPALSDTALVGPLASAAQRERVRGYIQRGLEEGARLVCGGLETPAGLDQGFFVEPTVFSDVRNDMVIAREEIFGPVLCIIAYDTIDDAIALANDSEYGLAGGVWAGSDEEALGVATRLRTGQVEINGGTFNPGAPFGGFKLSGIGRELGRWGIEEFLETQAIQHPVTSVG